MASDAFFAGCSRRDLCPLLGSRALGGAHFFFIGFAHIVPARLVWGRLSEPGTRVRPKPGRKRTAGSGALPQIAAAAGLCARYEFILQAIT